GVLVEHAAGDPTGQLGLGSLERVGRSGLVAAGDRRLDLLHEGTDAAHARTVDVGALLVAADALLGLRRIGHVCPYLGPLVARPESSSESVTETAVARRKAAPLAARGQIVKQTAPTSGRRGRTRCCVRPARSAGLGRRSGRTAGPRGRRRRSGWRSSRARRRDARSRASSSRRRRWPARAPRGSPARAAPAPVATPARRPCADR